MLSIIVCSRSKTLSKEFIDNIENSVGVDYEIIAIDNSENAYTIFSAYNSGFSRSKYAYLCFVHEDVLFHSQNWGATVIEHLQQSNVGIIGLAGDDLITRVPAAWSNVASTSTNIIQSDRRGKKATIAHLYPPNYNQTRRSVILLDGVFLCMRRELMNEIQFDESFNGFHGYDFDITIQSTIAGYTNHVIYDIKLEHFSRGKTDIVYYRNLIAIFRKWEKYLPLIGKSLSEEQKKNVSNIEENNLQRLVKKMARKGFQTNRIIEEITYYTNIIGSTKTIRNLKFRLFLIRLFNCPKYLLK